MLDPAPDPQKFPRVRFAPSPTGFLHVGSARTFIFNWLFARHNHGVMVLRLDDTDVERNTEASVQSIFEGLRWLGLDWDEEYKQSERLALHRQQAEAIFAKGLAYRDFTPAHAADEQSNAEGAWLFNPGMRELSREESDRRANSGESFALRYRVPRGQNRTLSFTDSVYGEQSKAADEVEDFALLRSDSFPTYHLASCADDADLNISHIIRGQDHLTNTFKHLLIFEALGVEPPQFAHLPLLVAPDGAKLSKRKHGPVVSVTTYRDAGFLARAFINFLCLLGWSPKDDREFMSLDDIRAAFTLENVNRSNAVVNFTDADPFDPKAVWLNAEHIRALSVEDLSRQLAPFFEQAGFHPTPEQLLAVTPLIRERIKLLSEAPAAADFFFLAELAPYDPAELIPPKGGDAAMARRVLQYAIEILPNVNFDHDSLDQALREAAKTLGLKAGPMFQPIRVAVCGRKNAPPLFETMAVLGRDLCLARIRQAEASLSRHWQYTKRPDGKIAVTLDNNVWDFLFQRELDLASELPSDQFAIFIPREIEIETLEIPNDDSKIALKEYIDRTRVNRKIKTTSVFGFARKGPGLQRFGGFGQGTFQSQTEREFYAAISGVYLFGKREMKSGLTKNEGDAAVAAASFFSIVLTCELPSKAGPLRYASQHGGKVLYLKNFEGSELKLKECITALYQQI